MTKSKNPQITEEELIKELSERTGMTINIVFHVIRGYYEVVKECIENGVEVRMGELGVMTWRVNQPKKDVVYYNVYQGKKDSPKDLPGYWVPKFTPKPKWKKELKESSKFWNKENEGKEEREDE